MIPYSIYTVKKESEVLYVGPTVGVVTEEVRVISCTYLFNLHVFTVLKVKILAIPLMTKNGERNHS